MGKVIQANHLSYKRPKSLDHCHICTFRLLFLQQASSTILLRMILNIKTFYINNWRKIKYNDKTMLIVTKYYGDFSFNWSREWIWHTRVYDDGTIDCGTLPCYMSMPPKGSPLARNRELVCIRLAWSYGTLCNICWTVRPSSSQLLDSMPAPITFVHFGIQSQSIALVTK